FATSRAHKLRAANACNLYPGCCGVGSAGGKERAQHGYTEPIFTNRSKFSGKGHKRGGWPNRKTQSGKIFHDRVPPGIFVPAPEISRSCKTSQTPRLRVSLRKFPLERGKP